MSIREFKNVVRERLAPELEELIENARPKVTKQVAKQDVIFEYASHGNFFLVNRYEIVFRANKYSCFCNLHLLVMMEGDKNRNDTISSIMPNKFLFKNLVHSGIPIDLSLEVMIERYFSNNYELTEEFLLNESSMSLGFIDRACEVLRKWSLEQSDTLILAPSNWVYGVIKHMPLISQRLRNEGQVGWVDIL